MTERIDPVPRSVVSSPDTQAAIWFLGVLSQVRLSGEQTGEAFSLADNLARRGNARSPSTNAEGSSRRDGLALADAGGAAAGSLVEAADGHQVPSEPGAAA